LRARNSEFPCNPAKKSLVGALRRPLVSTEKIVEFLIGVFIVPSPNLFSKQSEVMNVARSENVVM
jgi:hypothetical protein